MRNELCSNNLRDLGLKKGIENLKAVRQRFQIVTDRFASFQAEWLNVHADFSLLERLAHLIQKGSTRVAGIKIHDTRMIRLMGVLIDAGTTIDAFSTRRIHQILLERFRISEQAYSFNHKLDFRNPIVTSESASPLLIVAASPSCKSLHEENACVRD